MLIIQRKVVRCSDARKIISRKSSAKKQKLQCIVSDFKDTNVSDTELSELYRYIALKPDT